MDTCARNPGIEISFVRYNLIEGLKGDARRVAVRESWPSSDVEMWPVSLRSQANYTTLSVGARRHRDLSQHLLLVPCLNAR